MSSWRWIAVGGIVSAAACVSWVGPSAAEAPPAPDVPSVRTAWVQPAPATRPVQLHGVTRASDRGELALTVGGKLRSRSVALGDSVQRGDALAVLDRAGFDNARRAADATVTDLQARLEQLQRDRARLGSLEAGRTVSQAELERVASEEASVRANLDAARASATEASRQRDEAVLVAPFDGVVSAVYRQPGEAVSPGVPVLQLTGDAGLEVELQVPEHIWAQLSPDDAATVELPALGRTLPAEIRSIGGAARAGGLFPVVLSLPTSAGTAAGLTARVQLDLRLQAGLVVPIGAVVDPTGSAAAVYRLDGDVAHRVSVQPEVLLGKVVAISGDLEADDEVVVAGQTRLLDGDRVQVLR